MKLILFLLQRSRWPLLSSIATSIIGGVATAALLVLVEAALGAKGLYTRHAGVSFVAVVVIALLFRTFAALLLVRLGQGSLLDLRMTLSRQILQTPLKELESIGDAKVLAVLTDDIPNLTNFVAQIPLVFTNGAIALTCLLYLAWLSWQMFLLLVAFLAVGITSYAYLTSLADRHVAAARAEHGFLLTHFRSLIGGIKELKLHRGRSDQFFARNLGGRSLAFRRSMTSGLNVYALAISWGELLIFAAVGLVTFAPFYFAKLDRAASAGFVLGLLYLVGPLESLISVGPGVGRANAALKAIQDLGLSLASGTPADPLPAPRITDKPHRLTMRDVLFRYQSAEDGESFLLGPINLTVEPGEIVFLVGGNGSGKTTFAKLLVGLYEPQSGAISVDGVAVTPATAAHYRQLFSTVFFDFHLFEELLGLEGVESEASANRYLEKLHLSHKVTVREGAFSTLQLSQGQRKRLALLTAYLEDRPFFLFDEWAADQDSAFKEIFYHEILQELRALGKTVFVISHDDRYFHVGDRVLKLEGGQVVSDTPAPSHGRPSILEPAAGRI